MPFRFPARWDGRDGPHLGPNPLAEALAKARAAGNDPLDLTVSNPTAVGLSFPEDWTDLLGGDRAGAARLRRYAPDAKGLPSARDAVAAYYNERDSDRGESVHADDLLLTAGTSEAYSHLFKLLCDAGDEILVPRPSYPLLETLADLAGLTLDAYPLVAKDHRGIVSWSPDRAALTALITPRTRAIIVVQPNNPTGSVLSPDDARWLLELAARRGLALVVDEVFADYRHDGHDGHEGTPLLRSAGPLVFTLNGLSKLLGLPQLKLAWIHVAGNTEDKARAKDMLEWIGDAHLSVGSASQLACPELLRRRGEFQAPIRERLRVNLATLREIGAAQPRLLLLWPQGGWCVPVRCAGLRKGKNGEDDEALAIRLVESHGVLVQPGYFFDFEDEETIVVSLLPEPEIFREGLERLARALT